MEQREKFEAWAKRQPGDTIYLDGGRFGASWVYAHYHTHAIWVGWQASAAESAAEIERLRAALQEILRVHANDDKRPKAFYLADRALSEKQS